MEIPENIMEAVREKARKAKEASYKMAIASTDEKNEALKKIAESLWNRKEEILSANEKDINAAKEKGLPPHLIDRLALNEKRIKDICDSIEEVIALPDPVGEIIEGWKRPNGLVIQKVRVPLGVIGIIYEARPNVTVDAATLCLKAGNCVVLRGGSEAINSNICLVEIMRNALSETTLPPDAVQVIEDTSRLSALALMRQSEYLDVLIPRGGAGLIKSVLENARLPVIETGVGNCHTYVHEDADIEMAERIVINAKCQRPSVCNAMETLLVHKNIAPRFLPRCLKRLRELGVEIRGCERTRELFPEAKPATEEDWYTEYLALILAVKVVDSLEEAIAHINKYGSKHSEAIITSNVIAAKRFCDEVDASTVYVNASTRFTDGGQFGLGAEIGISTQKLHARGPMGLRELTSYKWVVYGEGQIRT
jgi:glutamate-5-semialdehyde dehydrogenase